MTKLKEHRIRSQCQTTALLIVKIHTQNKRYLWPKPQLPRSKRAVKQRFGQDYSFDEEKHLSGYGINISVGFMLEVDRARSTDHAMNGGGYCTR
jgi:hypothetical protein